MRIHIRYLLIAVTVSILSVLVLPGSSARLTGNRPAKVGDSSAGTTQAPAADLAITKSGPDTVMPGSNFTYTISVTNGGPDNAANATLSDTLPAGITFVSLSSPGGWSCTPPAVGAGGLVTCSNPSLALTSGDVFTLIVKVDPSVAVGTVISNTATVGAATSDPNNGDNSSTATTTVVGPSADVAVTKSGPNSVTPGSDLSYTITVVNLGPSDATTVSLNDPLPAETTFVSLSSPVGWSCSTPAVGGNGTVTCTIGSLSANASAVFTLVVHVSTDTPPGTFITNKATVSTATFDPYYENNESAATAVVPAPSADLGVTKSSSANEVFADSDVTYTIQAFNFGPDPAANAMLNDPLTANMTFVSLSQPAGWSCMTPAVGAGGTITCTKPSLPITTGDVFTLVGHVPPGTAAGTQYPNQVTISSTTEDPNSENNSGNTLTTVVSCFTNLTVTTNADSGAGSLRQAILDICPGGTIGFDMNQVTSPIALTSAELVINKDLTILGPGANMLTVQRSTAGGTPNFRVFNVNSGKTVSISDLTMSNGSVTDQGGGIHNSGTLTLRSCVVSGNQVTGSPVHGGGINNDGTVTVLNSTISGNSSLGAQGFGGGIYNLGGLNLINSTISGNSAGNSGGGIFVASPGTVNVTNTTIAANIGSGIENNSGIVNVRNTIVFNGAAGGDVNGAFNSQGHNLIGNKGGSTGFINGSNGDKVGTVATPMNPLLASLQYNGGPTRTHALLYNSPAVDAGDGCVVDDTCSPALGTAFTTDQR